MSDLIVASPIPLPEPKTPIRIRPGVVGDVPFMDSLQKLHSKQVGWMPTAQFEGKINLGHVLIAEEKLSTDYTDDTDLNSESAQSAKSVVKTPVGYLIGNDRYFKRDDVGILYQLNVMPGKQRGFIGAALLRSQFERSAYGCRLYCCWCAQDIAANHFWEAMGFVPLAFRTGSEKRSRVHIFWQKRIRSGDNTTPWWFPSQTSSGAIREDRIVLPIPPGTRWSDAKPLILPKPPAMKELNHEAAKNTKETKNDRKSDSRRRAESSSKHAGLWFTPATTVRVAAERQQKRIKPKFDPNLIAAARELRDRWLEQVNAGLVLAEATGKYDVHRTIADAAVSPPPLLIEAA